MPTVPGWYRDPDNSSALRWWDGTAWAAAVSPPIFDGDREPAIEDAAPAPAPPAPLPPPPPPPPPREPPPPPPPPPQPSPPAAPAAPAPLGQVPQRPQRGWRRLRTVARRRPGRVITAGAAILVAALVAAIVVPLLHGDPALTFDGRPLHRPEQTLAAGEAILHTLVDRRHGAVSDETRCYFSLPAGETADVDDRLRCGPVLFVDGEPDRPYLSFPLDARASGGGVRLVPTGRPESPEPAALARGERLRRPDGRTPPDRAGGLEAPPPPRAGAGLVATDDLDGIALDDPGPDARIGSWGRSYRLVGTAQPDRIGHGDRARRPAEGERFVAARIEVAPGEARSEPRPPPPTLAIQIGDHDPVPVPAALASAAAGHTTGLVISVPDNSDRADLVVSDLGVDQRLSLLTGEPDPGNPSVLRREPRSQPLVARADLPFTATAPGRAPESFTVEVSVQRAGLYWFFGRDGSLRPPGPDRAYLVPDTHFAWDPALGLDDGTSLEASAFRLELPGGTVIPATDLAPSSLVLVVFDVPADFTTGTLVVGGRYTGTDGAVIDFGTAALRASIEIPLS